MYHMRGGLWDVNISMKAWKSGGNHASEGCIWKVCLLGPPSPTTEVALVMARSLTDLFLLPNPCLIPSFSPLPAPGRVIISPSCQLDPIQKKFPIKMLTSQPRKGIFMRECLDHGSLSVGNNLDYGNWGRKIFPLWVIHSLGKGILSCMRGEGAEHKPACMNPLLCSDCGCNVTSCFQLCRDACYVEV